MKLRTMLVVAVAAVATLQTAFAQKLGIGDTAPPLKVAKWVKGDAIKEFDADKLYVVEFWATWCGPCKVSIPHLTEMAKKYSGKVSFTGVSVWEDMEGGKDYMKTVSDFVTSMGDKMDYNVAVDGTDMVMAKSWMEAAGENGIPAAFIIKGGKVVWIGHPMAGLDKAIDQIMDGSYDMAAFKTKRDAEKAKEMAGNDEQNEMMKKFEPISKAAEAGDYKTAVKELDKLFAAEPEMEQQFGSAKLNMLARYDEKAMYAYMKKLASGIYKDDAMQLNSMAWSIVDDKSKFKTKDYKVAIAIAEQACKLTKFEDAMILDTLAYAYFKDKQIKKAVATQTLAVKFLPNSDQADEATKKEIMDRLEMFKKADKGH